MESLKNGKRILEKSFKKWYKPWLEDVEVARRGRRQRGEQELRTGGKVVCKEGTPGRASIRVGRCRCRARRKKKRKTMMRARAKKRRKTMGRTMFGRGGGGARMRGGGGERRGGLEARG